MPSIPLEEAVLDEMAATGMQSWPSRRRGFMKLLGRLACEGRNDRRPRFPESLGISSRSDRVTTFMMMAHEIRGIRFRAALVAVGEQLLTSYAPLAWPNL